MSRSARAVALLALVALSAACGSDTIDAQQRARLAVVLDATSKYRDRDVAFRDGYRPLPRCIENDDETAALGLEYLHLRRSRDLKVELEKPEQLFYEEQPDGSPPVLVGVGYFVPDEGQKPPASPLGRLDGPIPGQYFGQEPHFELHVWIHRPNPDGMLAFFNPEVSCLDRAD